ncbi:NAD-dependent epimerase/dehydratase family protein [Streptomyces sp. CB01881]|uniref:NAD-dependent epimerase/dehydratase family protein n=1 Tax=Streptomyces sp. CB01881 TaxID=2078691 RepID=UPI000CDBB032|nr:NAD-dependent epimerase/dehydratase family protein [Streptomyces sp. CB01881]AUY47761.1 reductase [Streptomyces sp. CB01881]TYC77735.1 reductase [Streptomyces sp. CB01881]
MRNVCVIGGSRYFGLHLVTLLRESGARVTVVNRGSAPPPPGVEHVVADRSDEAALATALGGRTFDAVIDQVLYTPDQAAVARRVFGDRTGRYVMTSTMEVYDPATSPLVRTVPGVPVPETAVDPAGWPVDLSLPWHDPAALARRFDEATRYAEGKRQAEAVLAQDPPFSWASVRSAHVLGGGARDFTGRLAHYTELIAAGLPVVVHGEPQPTSFVHHEEIAAALVRMAAMEAVGPVNACSDGPLDVVALCELIAGRLGTTPRYRVVPGGADTEGTTGTGSGERAAGADTSPFSFDRWYPMDNRRAAGLGLDFTPTAQWLPGAVAASALTPTSAKVA